MVVDDEVELRAMVAEYLGRHGFAVRTAGNAAELDACLAEAMPDLLILDVNMPDEDGFLIARRVRARSNVPILMLTAARHRRETRRCDSVGMRRNGSPGN